MGVEVAWWLLNRGLAVLQILFLKFFTNVKGSNYILYSWCSYFSSSMKEKCILPMMKIMSVQEGILF